MTTEQIKKSRKILRDVANTIEANPKHYNQGNWCNTACCIAGHIVFNQGAKRIKYSDFSVNFNGKERDVNVLAAQLLGVSPSNRKIMALFTHSPHYFWEGKWAERWSKAKNRNEKAVIAVDYIRKYVIPKMFPLNKTKK